MKSALIPGLMLALVGFGAAAQDMKPPRLSFAQVDWNAAAATLADSDALGPAAMPASIRAASTRRAIPRTLARLNAVMAQRFTGIATSPVPVLLPFDVAALMRDQAAGNAADNSRYLSGFHAAQFFYPGPSGYDAAFAVRASDVPELSDIKYSDPIEVHVSGSALLYELDTPNVVEGLPVTGIEEEFPGIRRMLVEHHVRYTFVRFGVPYVVSVGCYETSSVRFKMPSCRNADQVALRFLRALRVTGGAPHKLRPMAPLPVERPAMVSQTFGYYGPGRIQSGTGFRGQSGRTDHTVYSQIRFPLADVPAYAGSELYKNNNRIRVSNLEEPPAISYAWRDNFCERRGFPVAQCPAGIGHQGQDLRPAQCRPAPSTDRCEEYGDIVAVRGGVILRSPKQEAAYLFVNSANEHIRFRYLHMSPRKMDADNLLSGRRVHEGEVIGQVSNFSMKEAGTSYHLHFDIQVPTKDGWVFVNPYMTLVSAYERLIGARGTELGDPNAAATPDPETTSSVPDKPRAEPDEPKRRHVKQSRTKSKSRHRRHYANR